MKKIISLLIILFVLSGCVSLKTKDVYQELTNVVRQEADKKYNSRNNNFSDYVSYYLPSDMTEIDSSLTTFTFKYNDSIILYNINIADLINNKYYPEEILNSSDYFYNEDYLMFENTGEIETVNGISPYAIRVYEIEGEYLMSFSDLYSQIYAYATLGDVDEVLRHIFIIAKLSRVEQEKVINNFSDKDVISATKKTISLFNYVYPSSGYLSDLINDPNNNENTQTDNNTQNEEYNNVEDEIEEFEENLD